MSWLRNRTFLLNLVVVGATVLFVAGTLVAGRAAAEPPPELVVGQPAPEAFFASAFIEFEDVNETERRREEARASVSTIYDPDPAVTNTVLRNLQDFFEAVRNGAFPPGTDPEVIADPTTTEAETTTTTEAETAITEAADEEETAAAAEDTTTTSTTTTTTTIPDRVLIDDQVENLLESGFRPYTEGAIEIFVRLYDRHLDQRLEGRSGFWETIEQNVLEKAEEVMSSGIRNEELPDVRDALEADPPFFFVADLGGEDHEELLPAAARVVSESLQPNEFVDEQATEDAREEAAAAVELAEERFSQGQQIVGQGELLTEVQIEAIDQLGLNLPEPGTSRTATAVLGGLAVLLAALFLWRTSPGQWSQPKHMALLGVLLLIAAVVSRVPELFTTENPQLAYLIPASMLGYTAAIMYDPRTALLTAVPMGMFTAISTQDPAITIYAVAATVAPVAFVSSVSTRRQLRIAVVLAALVLIPLAGSVAWLFEGRRVAVEAAAAGFAGGLVAGFIAQGLVSFLENIFRVTTTVSLLDLTDRNHPALRLIEERAPGTFNHSILVGNLAGKAARAIGADPLLAQAAAFYHDLGKTKHPQYFIENQFGVSNPHDELDPVQSAEIVRAHVTDGLELARQYRIPPDVAAGIEQHHGTGLMRYFYHAAIEADPGADPAQFRHTGVKPQGKEMAILMISDAVEAAARSLAQHEDPTADSLTKMVDSVVGEKLEDGQLDQSALTFGDLTTVKKSMVEALIGYYHTRIPYPGFPVAGAEVT